MAITKYYIAYAHITYYVDSQFTKYAWVHFEYEFKRTEYDIANWSFITMPLSIYRKIFAVSYTKIALTS